jgi:hypothetical protein
MTALHPPLPAFASPGGRTFTVAPGEHSSRYDGDPLWSDGWPILFNGVRAGDLYRNLNYGTTADGRPRWQASTRALHWTYAADAPTGIGFDEERGPDPGLERGARDRGVVWRGAAG